MTKLVTTKEVFYCPKCKGKMKFLERLGNGRTKDGTYRRRRFKCEDCDYQELIHAEGRRDLNQ